MLLWIRCAGCNDQLVPKLEADPVQLERDPIYVLCTECYVHIRTGYQRDRDRRQAGAAQLHLLGTDNG